MALFTPQTNFMKCRLHTAFRHLSFKGSCTHIASRFLIICIHLSPSPQPPSTMPPTTGLGRERHANASFVPQGMCMIIFFVHLLISNVFFCFFRYFKFFLTYS